MQLLCGDLSEEEFWSIRQPLIEAQKQQLFTETGIEASLAELRPKNENGKIKYTLTPQIHHAVFVRYPFVKRAFDRLVPHQVTSDEFWRGYTLSPFVQKRGAGPSTNNSQLATVFAQCYEQEQQAINEPSNVSPTSVPAFLNLTSLSNSPSTPAKDPMLKSFNQFSQRILQHSSSHHPEAISQAKPGPEAGSQTIPGPEPDHVALNSLQPKQTPATEPGWDSTSSNLALEREIVLEDLQPSVPVVRVPLNVQDQQRYFETAKDLSQDALQTLVDSQTLQSLRQLAFDLTHLHANLTQHLQQGALYRPDAFLQEFRQLCAFEPFVETPNDDVHALPRAMQQSATVLFLETQEVLRQYWAAVQAGSSFPDKAALAKRMQQYLSELVRKIEALQTSAPPDTAEPAILQSLFSSVLRAIQKAT